MHPIRQGSPSPDGKKNKKQRHTDPSIRETVAKTGRLAPSATENQAQWRTRPASSVAAHTSRASSARLWPGAVRALGPMCCVFKRFQALALRIGPAGGTLMKTRRADIKWRTTYSYRMWAPGKRSPVRYCGRSEARCQASRPTEFPEEGRWTKSKDLRTLIASRPSGRGNKAKGLGRHRRQAKFNMTTLKSRALPAEGNGRAAACPRPRRGFTPGSAPRPRPAVSRSAHRGSR